jgi:chalcone isomerase-like protein
MLIPPRHIIQKGREAKVNVRTIVAAATWCALICGATTVHARDQAGAKMPEVVKADGTTLALNGMGVGKKIFVHIYVVGLYLERKTTDAQTAISTDEGKRISLILLRDVSRQQFVQALEKGMIRNSGVAMPILRARLNVLEQALPALEKANIRDFTYLPGIGTVVRGQGRELKIPGKDFADALLSVWLGPKAADGTLREDLLGL